MLASTATSSRFVVHHDTHPQTIAVLATRAEPVGIDLVVGDVDELGAGCFGALFSFPTSTGAVRDWRDAIATVRDGGGISVVTTDPMACVLGVAPGELGADIVVGSAQRFGGRPGVPTVAAVEEFIGHSAWVDIYAVVDEWFLCAHGKGLKRIAPAAGFAWRDPEAGGENSMRWYRDAVGLDGAPPDPAQRQRLLEYNADDVAATHALRVWMTSPAIDEVPLAADL